MISQALTKAEKRRYPGDPSFITFRHEGFNLGLSRDVKGVKWSPILQQQIFTRWLKFAIEEMAKVVSEAPSYAPVTLKSPTFGDAFNCLPARVVRSPSLRKLVLGLSFDPPILGVTWLATVRYLALGAELNKNGIAVTW